MEELIQIFKALSDTSRLKIIKMLEVKPLCVCEIAKVLKLANSTVSKHLSILKRAGLINSEKEGRWVNYSIQPKKNEYTEELSYLIQNWINDDEIIIELNKRAQKVDRTNICSD